MASLPLTCATIACSTWIRDSRSATDLPRSSSSVLHTMRPAGTGVRSLILTSGRGADLSCRQGGVKGCAHAGVREGVQNGAMNHVVGVHVHRGRGTAQDALDWRSMGRPMRSPNGWWGGMLLGPTLESNGTDPASASMRCQPFDHAVGVCVGREYWIEHLLNAACPSDQGEALDESGTRHCERWQP